MGNCKSQPKTNAKQTKKNTNVSELFAKLVPTKYTLSQTQLIYEAVLNAYIRKKSIPELGVVFMTRSGKSHISLPILPGDLRDMAAIEIDAIIKLLEDYFISIGVGNEIYINDCISNLDGPQLGYYKLYCHIVSFA